MASAADLLRASIWAKGLSEAELRQVDSELIERTVPSGALAFRKGERVEHWIGVIEGLLKLSSVSAEGKAVTFAGIPGGAWFGEGSMLKTETRKYDVVALRESRIALMTRATFDRLLDSSIAFNRFLLLQLNERLAHFIAIVESDRLLDPNARVARCLAALFNPYLYPVAGPQLQISQEEIGLLSGVSRQRTNQALQVLEKSGLLRVEYGAITVLDLDGLKHFGS